MPMKMEQTECSETSAYKLQAPGNYPKESTQHTEHGESLKLGILYIYNNWYVLYIYNTPPDDGLQICPKHVEVD